MKLANDAPYIVYREINISKITKRLLELDDSIWDLNKSRQVGNTAHYDTKSIILSNYPHESRPPINLSYINYSLVDKELCDLTFSLAKELENEFNGYFGKIVFANLPAGKSIELHTDPGYYLAVAHRLHIPIITNNGVLFEIGSTMFHMPTGMLYQINNMLPHAVYNTGEQDRIHLMIDIIPKSIVHR